MMQGSGHVVPHDALARTGAGTGGFTLPGADARAAGSLCLKEEVSERVSHFLVCDLRLGYRFFTDRTSAMAQFRTLALCVDQELGSDHPMTIGVPEQAHLS